MKKRPCTTTFALVMSIIVSALLVSCSGLIGRDESQKTSHNNEQETSTILAEYKGGTITKEDLDFRLEKIPPMYRKRYETVEGQKELLEGMAVETVFYRKALQMGIQDQPEVQQRIENASRPILISAYRDGHFKQELVLTDKEKRDYYEENKETAFRRFPDYTIQYIQVESMEKGTEALKKLQEGAGFTDIMNQYSIHGYSKEQGGIIRGIRNNGTIPGIGRDAVLDSLIVTATGKTDYTGPVLTEKGVHIFKIIEFTPAGVKPYEEVEEQIERRLLPQKESELYEQAVADFFKKYQIDIDEDNLKSMDLDPTGYKEEALNSLLVDSNDDRFSMTLGEFYDKTAYLNPQERSRLGNPEARTQIIRRMIEDDLFYYDALDKGYGDQPDVRAQLDQNRRHSILRAVYDSLVIQAVKISDEEIETYYRENIERFGQKAFRDIRMFQFDREEDANKYRPEVLDAIAKQDTARIVEIVKNHTRYNVNDGVVTNITDSGNIPNVVYDKNFSKLVWETEPGAVSPVFQDKSGFWVFFQVTRDVPAENMPLEEVSRIVEGNLMKKYQTARFEELKSELSDEFAMKTYPERLEIRLSAEELFDLAEESQKKKKYLQAIDYYDEIIQNYPNGTDDYKAAFMKAFIFTEDLHQDDEAKVLFEEFLKKYPTGELHESAEFMLRELNGESNSLDIFEE